MSDDSSVTKQAEAHQAKMRQEFIESTNKILKHLHEYRAQLVSQLDDVDRKIAEIKGNAEKVLNGDGIIA